MKSRVQGMTMVELMIAMLLLAILMAIAIPSFREFSSNNRTVGATNDLVTALNLARSEALRRATTTIVCASVDKATCSGAVDWSPGWIVFVDTDGNGAVGANELLQVWNGVGGAITATADRSRATYNAMGMGQMGAGFTTITFRIGDPGCTGLHVGQTVISTVGSLRSTKVACPP